MDNSRKPTVVLVDDEDMVITSIRAYLQLETDYDIQGFTEADDALKYIEKHPIEVAVSDYLMPKMNGIQFLGKAKQLQPESSRVLLTGHADKQSAVNAINQVGLFQYLEKPWDNAQLLLVVNAAIERTRLYRDLKEKISQLDTAHSSLKDVQKRLIQAFL